MKTETQTKLDEAYAAFEIERKKLSAARYVYENALFSFCRANDRYAAAAAVDDAERLLIRDGKELKKNENESPQSECFRCS